MKSGDEPAVISMVHSVNLVTNMFLYVLSEWQQSMTRMTPNSCPQSAPVCSVELTLLTNQQYCPYLMCTMSTHGDLKSSICLKSQVEEKEKKGE